MSFLNFLSADEPAGFGLDQILLIALVAGLALILFVLPVFTNKKRQKSVTSLHDALKIGDKIMTIGGIIGTVVQINSITAVDKEIVVETGVEGSKTTLTLDIKSLFQVIPPINTEIDSAPTQAAADLDVFSENIAIEEEAQQAEPATETVQTETAAVVTEEPAQKEEAQTEAAMDEAKAEDAPVIDEPDSEKTAKAAAKPRTSATKTRKVTKK